MNSISPSHFLSACRVCFKKNVGKFKSLLETHLDNEWYQDIFFKCTTIKVVDKPEQPPWICEDCDLELIKAYKFRAKCIESDTILSAVFVKPSDIVQTEELETVENIDCLIKEERNSDNELEEDQSYESDATAEFVHIVKVKTEELEIADSEKSISLNVLVEDPSYSEFKGEFEYEASINRDRDELKRAKRMRKTIKRNENKMRRDELNEKPLEICKVCNKPLPRKRSNYNKHIRSHYPGNPTPFECKECDRKFSNMDKLDSHVQIHSYPLKCNYCDVRFQTHYTRVDHENRKHTFVRPFKCDQCENLFFTFNQLDRHMHRFHLLPDMEHITSVGKI